MAFRANLVNKQFNSPIKLYSPGNVAEALEKQKQILANGAVGIDFHNLAKPGNLANSAVLRMLEEEEANRSRTGGIKPCWEQIDLYRPWIERYLQHTLSGNPATDELMMKTFWSKLKRWSVHPPKRHIQWPPITSNKVQKNGNGRSAFIFGGKKLGVKRVAWPPPPEENLEEDSQIQFQQPVYSQGPQGVQTTSPVRPVAPPSSGTALGKPNQPTFSPPVAAAAPQPYHPVHFEPPKTTVTLLPSAPVRQAPPPVYQSQPVTATVKGGVRMRGDMKWPPESVKQQVAAENEARIALAKGPACRPRKVKKDYSQFFAQHALTATYPGYKAPPGTQHYVEGTSNF